MNWSEKIAERENSEILGSATNGTILL